MLSPLRLSALAALATAFVTTTVAAPTVGSTVSPTVSSTVSQTGRDTSTSEPTASPAVVPNPTVPAVPSASDSELLPPATSDAPPESLILPNDTAPTTHYSDGQMSMDVPATWEIEVVDNGLTIANITTVEAELVATQVVRMASPPGPVVNANIDSFIEEGSAMGRYQAVNIDGQDAVMMWLSERPDSLPAAIATFIGYGDETIFLFSRYAPTNESAEDDILRLHTSFSNLAVASVESTAESAEDVVKE